jgi:hypothetical protein
LGPDLIQVSVLLGGKRCPSGVGQGI